MAERAPVEKYGLAVAFERVVATLACSSRTFWKRIGYSIDPEALTHAPAVFALRAAKAIAAETGQGGVSTVVVVQRIHRLFTDGKLTHEQVVAVSEMFDAVEDAGAPDEEVVIAELAPVIRQRMKKDTIHRAVAAYGGNDTDAWDRVLRDAEAATKVGAMEESEGAALDDNVFALLAERKLMTYLPTGIPELDAFLDGGIQRQRLGVIMADPGNGKCHAKGQGILLADGRVKAVENVRVGDRLAAPAGKVRRVLQTNRGRGEMFEIRPVKGKPWRVNRDYVLTVVRSGSRQTAPRDVSLDEFLGWPVSRRERFKLLRSAADFRTRPVLPLDPYFLGVYLGDGSTRGTDIRITTTSVVVLDCVAVVANDHGLRLHEYPAGGCSSWGMSGRQGRKNPVARKLEGLELRGCRAEAKFIPESYKTARRAQRLELLAGLLDTDGSLNNGCFDYVSKSKRLAEDVAFVARSVGLAAYVSKSRKACQTEAVGIYWRVGISGTTSDVPCRIVEKQPGVRLQRKDVLHTGFTVAPVGVADYYGFTLDGDGRYLLDDFTVTHNSMFLGHVSAEACLNGLSAAYASAELPESEVLARLVSNLVGMETRAVLNGHMPEAQARYAAMRSRLGPFHVRYFTPGVATVGDIKGWVADTERISGRPIDLLVVDPIDEFVFAGAGAKDSTYTTQGRVTKEIRNYVKERHIVGWGASHVKAGDARRKVIGLNDASDSRWKVKTPDVVVSAMLGENGSEVVFNIAKNRGGKGHTLVGPLPTGFAYGMMVNVARGDEVPSTPEKESAF